MRKAGLISAAALVVLLAALFGAWATSPDPKFNPASFESTPLAPQLMPLDQAITLAQYADAAGSIRTLVVLSSSGGSVSGIDLRELGAGEVADPLDALAQADLSPILSSRADRFQNLSLPLSRLLPSGPGGMQHIGTGTNFPEHATEVNSDAVFQFPKFGPASPARTQVRVAEGILLDYEVELCVRFDRDLRTLGDFDEAVKAFFLCGDFTNRTALINLADPDNMDSGFGFSDAKSGPDFFPTGPFLVVPRDWEAFVDDVRMTTSVNGEARQDARGSEMTLDYRQLVGKALADMSKPRFLYRGQFVRLAPDDRIARTATLMSGTAEGTILMPPTRGDIIEASWDYLRQGGPLGGERFMAALRRRFISNELAGGHFLQPGDSVRHASNYLGDIQVQVTR